MARPDVKEVSLNEKDLMKLLEGYEQLYKVMKDLLKYQQGHGADAEIALMAQWFSMRKLVQMEIKRAMNFLQEPPRNSDNAGVLWFGKEKIIGKDIKAAISAAKGAYLKGDPKVKGLTRIFLNTMGVGMRPKKKYIFMKTTEFPELPNNIFIRFLNSDLKLWHR